LLRTEGEAKQFQLHPLNRGNSLFADHYTGQFVQWKHQMSFYHN
jgi:hypothetical protein